MNSEEIASARLSLLANGYDITEEATLTESGNLVLFGGFEAAERVLSIFREHCQSDRRWRIAVLDIIGQAAKRTSVTFLEVQLAIRAIAELVLPITSRIQLIVERIISNAPLRELCQSQDTSHHLLRLGAALPALRAELADVGWDVAVEPLRSAITNDSFPYLDHSIDQALVDEFDTDAFGEEVVLVSGDWINVYGAPCTVVSENQSAGKQVSMQIETTQRNVRRIASALSSQTRPVCIWSAVRGAGKTTAILEAARLLGANVRELVLDDDFDARTLAGYHELTGEGDFVWRQGPLAAAAAQGDWLVVEDLDKAPLEVQTALKAAARDFCVGMPHRKLAPDYVLAKPSFRLLATCSGPAENLLDRYWCRVEVMPLSLSDLASVLDDDDGNERFPVAIRDAVLSLLTPLNLEVGAISQQKDIDVRAALRILRRIRTLALPAQDYINESDRSLAALEVFDVCYAAARNIDLEQAGAVRIACALELDPSHFSERACLSGSDTMAPTLSETAIGRVPLLANRPGSNLFALTPRTRRLMERIAACVARSEACLLVGEPGSGKTTLVQNLAKLTGASLLVLNLSHATDADELLGGVRPASLAHSARRLLEDATRLFEMTFDAQANRDFMAKLRACLVGRQYAKLCRGIMRAAAKAPTNDAWSQLAGSAASLERRAKGNGPPVAFVYLESALSIAARDGGWVLLDEVNLAPGDVLQRLSPLLDAHSTHQNFRVLAAMNPPVGSDAAFKKELPTTLRSRFTEIFVREPDSRDDLAAVACVRLDALPAFQRASAATRRVLSEQAVALHLRLVELCREGGFHTKSSAVLVDGAGAAPRYSLRTLCRALDAAVAISVPHLVKASLEAALREGFELAYATQLVGDNPGGGRTTAAWTIADGLGLNRRAVESDDNDSLKPASRPAQSTDEDRALVAKLFWLRAGPRSSRVDWAADRNGTGDMPRKKRIKHEESSPSGRVDAKSARRYVLTETSRRTVRRIARALAFDKAPILLQGPTCAGKTTAVSYLAAKLGIKCVRVNNHEHTDVSEYIGRYAPCPRDGSIIWVDGALATALRRGHWILLDELNLAPADVLEALNRLLDHNRELRIPETGEIIQPAPGFALFATQNPADGNYGGRKPLSRAFRDRFVEVHVDELPSAELTQVLTACFPALPPSLAQALVDAHASLQRLRTVSRGRDGGALFFGKHALSNSRDILKWAKRCAFIEQGWSEEQYDRKMLALVHGDALLVQRLRSEPERVAVISALADVLKTPPLLGSEAHTQHLLKIEDRTALEQAAENARVAPTAALIRLVALATSALDVLEPVLLVGEAGTGKTTACALAAAMRGAQLKVINCHLHSEAADFLGALRPARSSSENGPLFKWTDGALVAAMRAGDWVLLDELNLADDAVLERLNSVLEPTRTITLAEKGAEDDVEELVAAPGFRLIATMNPGGDHGKRELSPALRSRFTEIWVPPLSTREDKTALVAAALLGDMNSDDSQRINTDLPALCDVMLDFEAWCHSSENKLLKLSTRDLAAWGHFTREALLRTSMAPWAALGHGAALACLDGLAISAGGGTEIETWRRMRAVAESTLVSIASARGLDANKLHQLQTALNWDTCGSVPAMNSQSAFGVDPFFINTGVRPLAPMSSKFCAEAPTTAANFRRVLRACVLPRAVLLEGPPGVGKSALVSELARSCGRLLSRVNLSEHADLSDLVGADLPIATSESGKQRFAWHDGPLLAAVKAGEWILLDELNLAPQPVLEGLNAVLDHRAELFVPELGTGFKCGPGFRLFATQNSVSDSAGRRLLPRSFLDRFTRVSVSDLDHDDLVVIAKSKYSTSSVENNQQADLISRLVTLLKSRHDFAAGADVNVRDLERWCTVAVTEGASRANFAVFGPRCRDERQHKALREIVGDLGENVAPHLVRINATPNYLQAGAVALPRRDCFFHPSSAGAPAFDDDDDETFGRTQSHLTCSTGLRLSALALEASARALRLHWPLLLVGQDAGDVAALLADAAGAALWRVQLSPATDVTDLLGGYEQIDDVRLMRRAVTRSRSAVVAARQLCLCTKSKALLSELEEAAKIDNINDIDCFQSAARAFVEEHGHINSSELQTFEKAAQFAVMARRSVFDNQRSSGTPPPFRWVDGIVVAAVLRGAWILLEDANLCAPSVLDRLNSLLEPGGSLALSDGLNDTSALRVIVQHPSFRMILSTDPSRGELSRALRNRCVEVAIEPEDTGISLNRWLSPRNYCDFELVESLLEFSTAINTNAACLKILNAERKKESAMIELVSSILASLKESNSPILLDISLRRFSRGLFLDNVRTSSDDNKIQDHAENAFKDCLKAARFSKQDIEIVNARFQTILARITASPIFTTFLHIRRQLWDGLCPEFNNAHQYHLEMADAIVAFHSLSLTTIDEKEGPPVEARRALARANIDSRKIWGLAARAFNLFDIMSTCIEKASSTKNIVSAVASVIDATAPYAIEATEHTPLVLLESLALRLCALVLHQGSSTDNLTIVACRSREILDIAEKLHQVGQVKTATSRLALTLELMVSETARRDGTICSPLTWRRCGDDDILWRAIARGGWPKHAIDTLCIADLCKYGDTLSWPSKISTVEILDEFAGKQYRFGPRLAALLAVRGDMAVRREASDALATALAALRNTGARTQLIETMRASPKRLAQDMETAIASTMEYWQKATLDLAFDCFDADEPTSMYDETEAKGSLSSQSLTIWAYDELNAKDANIKSCLLQKWASLQMAPLAELSLVHQEIDVLARLHTFANRPAKEEHFIASDFSNVLKALIDKLLARTARSPIDAATYTLVRWILSAKNMDELRRILQRSLSGMLRRWIERLWSIGTFEDDRDLSDDTVDEYALIAPKDEAFDIYQLEDSILRSTGLRRASHTSIFDRSAAESITRLLRSATPIVATMARRQQFVVAVRCLHESTTSYITKPLYSLLVSHTLATVRILYAEELEAICDDDIIIQVSKVGGGTPYLKSLCPIHQMQDSIIKLLAEALDIIVSIPTELSDIGYGWTLLGAARLLLAAPKSKEALDPATIINAKRRTLHEMLEQIEARIAVEVVDTRMRFGVDSSPRIKHQLAQRRSFMDSDTQLTSLDLERPATSPRFYEYAATVTDFLTSLGNPDRIKRLAVNLRQRQNDDEVLTWQRAATQFSQTMTSQHGYYRPDVVEPLIAAVALIRLGFEVMRSRVTSVDTIKFPFLRKSFTYDHSLAAVLQDELDLAITGCGRERVQQGVRALVASWRTLEESEQSNVQHFTSGGFTLRGVSLHDTIEVSNDDDDDDAKSPFATGEPILSSRTAVSRDDVLAAAVGIFVRTSLAHSTNLSLFSQRSMSAALRRAALLESYSQAKINDSSALGLSVILADAFSPKFRSSGGQYSYETELPELDSKALVSDVDDIFQDSDWQRKYAMPLLCLGLYDVNTADDYRPSLARDVEVYPRLQVSALLSRLRDLLLQWPANATLERTARIADAVLRSDAFTTTPTQIVTGIEILLKRAQDWQEHCAREFSLEEQLAPLRTFVTRGRKRELSEWSTILRKREIKAAQSRMLLRAMPRLDSILILDHIDRKMPLDHGPQWLFSIKRLGDPDDPTYLHPDTFAALVSFIRSATIGDFGSRLTLLKAFSVAVDSSVARCILALFEHYSQFVAAIENERYNARQPIAKTLNDEQRLARWDDRNFHALADCTEKSKRKLSKLIREYDEVLYRPVEPILLRLSAPPVWSSEKSILPTDSIIFPALVADRGMKENKKKRRESLVPELSTERVEELEITSARYAPRLNILNRKMQEIASFCSASSQRSTVASEITEAIFSRIENIRGSDKVPRSAKRRAVVDLVKGLQRHGISRIKVPEEAGDPRTSTCAVVLPQHQDELDFTELIDARRYATNGITEVGYLRSEYPQKTHDVTVREAKILKSICERLTIVVLEQRTYLTHSLIERRKYLEAIDHVSGRKRISRQKESQRITLRRIAEAVAELVAIADAVADALAYEDDPEHAKVATVSATLRTLEECIVDACVNDYKETLHTAAVTIRKTWFSTNMLRPDAIDSTLHFILDAEQSEFDASLNHTEAVDISNIDAAIEATLLSAQALAPPDKSSQVGKIDHSNTTLVDEHNNSLVILRSLAIGRSAKALDEIDGDSPLRLRVCDLATNLISAVDGTLVRIIAQHRATAKLLYVLSRVVRTLFSLGLCEAEEREDESVKGEEEGEGTGMGDGALTDDAKDVSNEITNEEQLLGTKQENETSREEDFDGGTEEKNPEEKAEEKADEGGIEMDAAFEGEMRDVDNEENADGEDEDDDMDDMESIDRELGDVGDGADAVDERLWGEEDKVGEGTDSQPLKASRADGAEQLEDEIRDKDNDEKTPDMKEESAIQEKKPSDQEKTEDESPLEQEDESRRAPGRSKQREEAEDTNDDIVDDDDKDNDENGVEEIEKHPDDDLPVEESVDFPEGGDSTEGAAMGDETEEEPREVGDNEGYELPDDMMIEDDGKNEDESPGSIAEEEEAKDMEIDAEDTADEKQDDGEGQAHGETSIEADAMAQVKTESQAEDIFGAATEFGHEALEAAGQGNDGAEEAEAQPDAKGNASGDRGNHMIGESEKVDGSSKESDKRPAPNPYRDAGDALKHWHRRLEIEDRQDMENEEGSSTMQDDDYDESGAGEYEYVRHDERATAQALGGLGSDEQVPALPPEETNVQESRDEKDEIEEKNSKNSQEKTNLDSSKRQRSEHGDQNEATSRKRRQQDQASILTREEDDDSSAVGEEDEMSVEDKHSEVHDDSPAGEEIAEVEKAPPLVQFAVMSSQVMKEYDVDMEEAYISTMRSDSQVENETSEADWQGHVERAAPVARRLCESLRTVLTPTVANRLRGDYRTGKRLSMRRVVDYIASGYRRDKIWMRRTRAAKRSYQILVAIDDSLSMAKSGAGDAALTALAAISTALSQLDAGDISIMAFGDDVRILHEFHDGAFQGDAARFAASQFRFDRPVTNAVNLLKTAIPMLRNARLAVQHRTNRVCLQLMIIVSDGHFDSGSRQQLMRLHRDAADDGVAVILLLLDQPGRNSLLEMKLVSFNGGGVQTTPYLEGYPFPCFVLLQDVAALPETLAHALKQWFEFHANSRA